MWSQVKDEHFVKGDNEKCMKINEQLMKIWFYFYIKAFIYNDF